MPSPSPSELALHARAMAHAKWAACDDPSAATAPARAVFLSRFERQVDPDGVLSPTERARRAEHARKAYFSQLAAKSVRARAARKGGEAA